MLRPDILWALIRRAFSLLREEGPVQLLKRTGAFAVYLHRRIFYSRSAYLYEHSLVPRDRAAFLPRLESWELRIVHSNEEADRVAAEGLEDFREGFATVRFSCSLYPVFCSRGCYLFRPTRFTKDKPDHGPVFTALCSDGILVLPPVLETEISI